MTWSDTYIGLPFREKGRDREACDCWGLVRLVLGEVQGVTVPSYTEDYASLAERKELAAVFARDSAGYPWRPIVTDEARPFDVVLFRRAGIEGHVGLVVSPGRMLHIEAGRESCIERFDIGKWAPRLIGAFRHAELMR